MAETTNEKVAAYLKRPYQRVVVPESDGTYRGQILEFPGCISIGDTASEALAVLEEVAESWIESSLARDQKIPEPIEESEFSGRLVLRLPRSLHKKAAQLAARDRVSLNYFIAAAVAEAAGERSNRTLNTIVTQVPFGPIIAQQLLPPNLSEKIQYLTDFQQFDAPVKSKQLART